VPESASGCAVPVYNASRIERRRCRRDMALYRNPRKGTRGGQRRSDPEASARMRQLVPTILCPNDLAAYPGYRQFRNRLLLVESFCECHLSPAKSQYGKPPHYAARDGDGCSSVV